MAPMVPSQMMKLAILLKEYLSDVAMMRYAQPNGAKIFRKRNAMKIGYGVVKKGIRNSIE